MSRCREYAYLMRWHKPIGIYLLLWPTLWSLWIANHGTPTLKIILIFTLGTIIMRSAGCVINDIADRKFDKHVERTKDRPLTAGRVTLKEAQVLFVFLVCCAALLVLFLNMKTIMVAVLGLVLASLYPFTKRFLQQPQLFFGHTFAWGVPMAYVAQEQAITWVTGLLYLAAYCWPVAYDTMYALADKPDDLKIGVHSTAIYWGEYDRLIIAMLQAVVLCLLFWIGFVVHLKWPYFIGLSIAACLFLYHQYLIKDRDRERCFKAFLNNHIAGMVIFIGVVFGLF